MSSRSSVNGVRVDEHQVAFDAMSDALQRLVEARAANADAVFDLKQGAMGGAGDILATRREIGVALPGQGGRAVMRANVPIDMDSPGFADREYRRSPHASRVEA